MFGCPTDVDSIARGVGLHGAAPNSAIMLNSEMDAARESISSGLYISWSPIPSTHGQLRSTAADEIRDGTGQCCRIGSHSICLCGHPLRNHLSVPLPKNNKLSYMKPPSCRDCKHCKGFNYAPSMPEECGQWWLARRKDFRIQEWRERVRRVPHEYACIGCDVSVADHETLFETRESRLARGAAVDDAYLPLSDMVGIRERVLLRGGHGPSTGIGEHQPLHPAHNPTRSRYQPISPNTTTDASDGGFKDRALLVPNPSARVATSPSDAVIVKKGVERRGR